MCLLTIVAPEHFFPYNVTPMNQKSITFRCTEQQLQRLDNVRDEKQTSRTAFITTALDQFLTYAEQREIRQQTLFELVQGIDKMSTGPSFEDQA